MSKLTKKGAQAVTADLDRLANLFQTEHETLGVPAKIATDFAYRLDLLSDAIEKNANIQRKALTEEDVYKEPGVDPEIIGMEQTGPIETVEEMEPFMAGEFTQQENRELRNNQQAGKLGPNVVDGPRPATPGKQASGFEALGRQTASAHLDTAGVSLTSAAAKNPRHAAGLTRLAAQVLSVKAALIEGKTSADHVSRTLQAVRSLLPHVAADEESEGEKEPEKVAKLVMLANKIASGSVAAPKRQASAHGYNLSA